MHRTSNLGFDLDNFGGVFRQESERACAVLGAALLDSRLRALYERRLRSLRKQLLDGNGPLSTFSARIQLANALGWISADVLSDLNQIRGVRNQFAHNPDHQFSFADESIAAKCRNLWVANVLIEAHEYAALKHPTLSAEVVRSMGAVFEAPRSRFEITVEILAQHLAELGDEALDTAAPNLREQLWALGSTVDIRVTGTGTVRDA